MQPRRSTSTDRRSHTPNVAEGNGGYRSSSSLSSSGALAVQLPPNPYQRIIQRIEDEERRIRSQLSKVPTHPNVLLKFCASCVDVSASLVAEAQSRQPHGHGKLNEEAKLRETLTLSVYANNALSAAHLIACRIEGLLRHSTHARRRYNSEDFLNLCRDFIHEAPKEEHSHVDLARRTILSRALQLVARICALSGNSAESQSAFEESWAVCNQSSATCDVASLINYLSVCGHHDVTRTLWLASDAVWLSREAVQYAIHETEVLLRRGAPSEREAALARRREYGRMLATAMMRQASAAMALTRECRASLRPTAFDTWRAHRTTLLFSSLQRVAGEELDNAQDAQLLSMVRDAVEMWSRCLMLWGSTDSPVHSMSHADRWTYQTYQSRQYAALNMDTEWRSVVDPNQTAEHIVMPLDHGDDLSCGTPALQAIEARYPFSLGVELVIVAGRGKSAFELLPPPSKSPSLVHQREGPEGPSRTEHIDAERRHSTPSNSPVARGVRGSGPFVKLQDSLPHASDGFVHLDDNYNDIGDRRKTIGRLQHQPESAMDPSDVAAGGDAAVPMPLVAMRSLRVKHAPAAPTQNKAAQEAERTRGLRSSAALRSFTDRAFDLFHNYRLPSASVLSDGAMKGAPEDAFSLPESRGPSPLPPPQPVAPIRPSHNGHGIGPLSSVNSSSAQSISSSFLLQHDVLDAAPMFPVAKGAETVSRDLFRHGVSISPDPIPTSLAIPIAEAPSPAALPQRRIPPAIR
jgi:hypothetical protein